ncbi:MAG: hypothetical protein ACXVZ1_07390 [Gaiellaceae bacterium]
MTLVAIAGLVALNLLLLAAGSGVLWATCGWDSWLELARLAGVAYLAGVATVGVLLVLELTAGISFGLTAILVTALAVLAVGIVLGRAFGRRRPPRRGGTATALSGPALVHGVGIALAVLYLEAQFRAARLAGLYEWDAMAFWVPKAKAIYYFGGLDQQFFSSLPGPSYPPLVPALDASAFTFMGATDPITLHLMFWFLLVGYLAAVAGLLATRVRSLALWLPLLLVALSPVLIDHGVASLADLLLDYFIGLAALLFALWLLEKRRWQLTLGGIFMTSAFLTKREGLLLGAVLLASLAIAACWKRRRDWRAVVLVAALAVVAPLIWRVWLNARGISTGGPEAGYLGSIHHLDRVWPCLKLTLRVLFAGDSWLIAPPLFVVAIGTALAARVRELALLAGSFFVLATLACAWVIVSFPSMPITTNASANPIVRLSGGLVVPMAGLMPLLLDAAWRTLEGQARPAARRRLVALRSRPLAWGIVAVATLAYPLAALAGGAPRFPSLRDCARPATHDGKIQLVLATFDSSVPADAMLARVRKLGFVQAQVFGDGCGRVKVAVPGYTTLAGARDALGEAEGAGLHAELQQG